MSKRLISRFIIFPALLFCLKNPVLAADPGAADWRLWFEAQIKQHPDVEAAFEVLNSSLSLSESLMRPLYNPEFGAEFEREGPVDNYSIGINQTIDWSDKRSVRRQQARYSRMAAQQDYELGLQEKRSEALLNIVAWRVARQRADLAQAQETQMETLLDLFTERLQTGDLAQVDAEIVFLNLSQRLNSTAQAQAALVRVDASLTELLPDWSAEKAQIPEALWEINPAVETDQWVEDHPRVLAARAQWQVLQETAELASRDRKADPTFGFNAGETNQEPLVSLSFSIPLHIRNDYSAEARAASQIALAAEARYRAVRRKQLYEIQAARTVLQQYRQSYERWQTLMQGRDESISELLESQWNSGDLSTTEYLLALQQWADGLMAGLELRSLFESATINWLSATGQLDAALRQLR